MPQSADPAPRRSPLPPPSAPRPPVPAPGGPVSAAAANHRVVIDVQQVSKTWGTVVGVDDLTFEVYAGEIFGFIGPSGSGKTTTMRLLNGVYAPTKGHVRLLGVDPAHPTRALHEDFGYMPQQFVLYPNLTIYENLNFLAGVQGLGWRERRGRLKSLLQFVELWDARSRLAGNASGGMQRRLELAGALVHNPRLLFVDEPTAGIDPVLRGKFWEEFRHLRDQGRTIFVTTQYVGESEYCDRVGVIRKGKLLAVATPLELRRLAMQGDVVDLKADNLTGEPLRLLLTQPYIVKQDGKPLYSWINPPSGLRVHVDDAADRIPEMLQVLTDAGAAVDTMQEYRPTFDEVFITLMGDMGNEADYD